MHWWQVNSWELAAQRKNRDRSDLGGTVRSKHQYQRFCQGACAYVGLIWEMVSLAGLCSSTEGMWLTQLSHDSGFSPSARGCPVGLCGYSWVQGCFPLYLGLVPAKWFSRLHAVCGEGHHYWTEECAQGVEPVTRSQWQGLPFERSRLTKALLPVVTLVSIRLWSTWCMWKVFRKFCWPTNPVSILGLEGSAFPSMGNLWAFWRGSLLLCWS